jgi:hypothetical protein
MMWRLIKAAIFIVGVKKLLGYKTVRKTIGQRIAAKTRSLLPI